MKRIYPLLVIGLALALTSGALIDKAPTTWMYVVSTTYIINQLPELKAAYMVSSATNKVFSCMDYLSLSKKLEKSRLSTVATSKSSIPSGHTNFQADLSKSLFLRKGLFWNNRCIRSQKCFDKKLEISSRVSSMLSFLYP